MIRRRLFLIGSLMPMLAGFGRRLKAQGFSASLSSARQTCRHPAGWHGRRHGGRSSSWLTVSTLSERRDAESADRDYAAWCVYALRPATTSPRTICGRLRPVSSRILRCGLSGEFQRATSGGQARDWARGRSLRCSCARATTARSMARTARGWQDRRREACIASRVTNVTNAAVEIAEVEEDVLIFV